MTRPAPFHLLPACLLRSSNALIRNPLALGRFGFSCVATGSCGLPTAGICRSVQPFVQANLERSPPPCLQLKQPDP
ncbi:hypothetical protein BO70DRAFT_366705 [Aspergillus heteromorphus CBS 117.55]|uniref:Uncharacterized protein n=1 Tax=Aspergillus heteromorphus CBS 117.55 TaxID=1448321 RepID=A0A317UW10_9EURO|nr:uncharacterized protein BO70DRAFT_366705 [Aspergillus heteromorphus CBS 117.55]PWY65581.1 hypothetical protein BO70DRAFT_366705 [Aspergillus heteromorphus CBS 117.55]